MRMGERNEEEEVTVRRAVGKGRNVKKEGKEMKLQKEKQVGINKKVKK